MKKIEILKLSPYCYPERISSSHLTEDQNEAFRDAGFHTTVFSPTPCRGIDKFTRKKYKRIKHETIVNGSVDIYRFSLFKEGKNPLGRAFRYVLCNIIQYNKGKKAKIIDAIYGASTPPTQGILCGKVAQKLSKKYGRKVPFIYNLQDVFPDSLVTAGLTSKGSLLWKIGRKIEDKTYRYADKIIVISDDIKRNIIEKGVPEEKIVVIPNWIDTDAVQPVSRGNNHLFDELGLGREGFYVTYAGNLGRAQGVDTLLEAADLLKNETDIHFAIFGGGSMKDVYAERIQSMNNVKLFPLQPIERVSEVYSLGDISVVACKRGTGVGAVPSKTFSIMATATPVLLSFDEESELWHIVLDNDCGYAVQAENAVELAEKIREAKNEPTKLEHKGANARSLALSRFSKQVGTKAYVELLLGAVKGIKEE